jgi:VWFA-related protein
VTRLLPVVVLGLALTLSAQTPEPQPRPPQQPIFRVEANFVRVDAYPTADGRPVVDLRADDFDVLEDGVLQKIETFEYVRVAPAGPSEIRVEPDSVRAARSMAENARSRVFVVFLDTGHVENQASHAIRRPLVNLLNRVLGPDDLVAVMTPEMSAAALTLARRTQVVEEMLARYWPWGKRDDLALTDPEEQKYELCYPDTPRCPENRQIVRELIARRRATLTFDTLHDLVVHLRGLREERKAVVLVTDGWILLRENRNLARAPSEGCGPVPGTPEIYIGPGGRPSMRPPYSDPSVASRYQCDADRLHLAQVDNAQRFHDLLMEANRANVSFYPVDPRGLPAWDAPLGPEMPPALEIDQAILRSRRLNLETMAETTDGLAVLSSNDLDKGLRRISDDLSSYYLLGYYSTNTRLDGKYRKIAVRVKRPGVHVRARRGYRAATREEVVSVRTGSAAAPPSPSPAEAAVATLAGLRKEQRLRTRAAWLSEGGLRVVAEIDPEVLRSPEWQNGGAIETTLSRRDGVGLARVDAALERGRRSALVQLSDVRRQAGEYIVRTRVRPVGGTLPLQDILPLEIPARLSPGAAWGALLWRRGPTTGPAFVPTADPRFRRNETIRVELAVASSVTSVQARLLDRSGRPMELPVGVRSDASGVVAELALAPLAAGDYVIALEIDLAGARHEEVVAFRVIP